MENTFIDLRGTKGQLITINVRYIIKFEPGDNCTLVYVDDRGNSSRYAIDIRYETLSNIIKEKR